MASKRKNKKRGVENVSGSSFKGVKGDFRGAEKLANELGLLNPTERLDTGQLEALTDPSSPAFVGQRSEQQKQFIDSMQGLAINAGQRSGEMKDYLSGLQQDVERAGQRSEEMKQIFEVMKGGLSGLNAQENTALREQASREVDRQFQGAMQRLTSAQARQGTRGGNALAQSRGLERDRAKQQSEMEQDLLVKNIDIQDKRRGEFQGALAGQEQNEFARRNAAQQLYGGALSGAENDEFNRSSTALSNYGTAVGNLEQGEFDRATTSRDQLLKAQMVNIGQGNVNDAKRAAALAGLTGYGLSKQTAGRNYRLAKQGMKRSGSTRGGGAPGVDPQQAYIDAVTKIGQQMYGEDTNV